jgi:hypothetical protein
VHNLGLALILQTISQFRDHFIGHPGI